jgi:hypothetical protein
MNYGYEKILEVQRRCGVSFEDADKALKAEKGDADKACALAMRKKQKGSLAENKFGSLKNFLTYRIKISKNGESKFNISMGIVLLISAVILMYCVIVDEYGALAVIYLLVFGITIFAGYSLEFSPSEEEKEKLERKPSEKTEDEVYETNAEHEVEPESDGYNSIEIE